MDVFQDDREPSQPLTQEQRDRIQRQKALALARRSARLSLSPHTNSPEAEFKLRCYPSSPLSQEKNIARNLNNENGGWGEAQKPTINERAGEVTLSKEQLSVLDAVAKRQSVFVTGAAGTGKSHILEYAIKCLRRLYDPSRVYVTASTGIAACSIGGTTLHSFAGVGLGTLDKDGLVRMVLKSKEKKARWKSAKALVIDEISMIDADLFDKVDYVGRTVRGCPDKPFGGLQLVVTGDFFQLPPVGSDKSFAFDAKCWKECFDLQMELNHVFRQSDREFIDMLNEVRRGSCSVATYRRLDMCRTWSVAAGIEPTKLFPRREDVDRENEQRLRALGNQALTFYSKDMGNTRLLTGCRAEPEVKLAVGSQVMLIKNLDTEKGLVNGAIGVIIRFCQWDSYDTPTQNDVTVSPRGGWPIVKFACEEGEGRIMKPEGWSVMEGEVEVAKRIQVPLILAWALSVHKCQGMTLECMETDLSRSFEYGMVYVALSRAKSL